MNLDDFKGKAQAENEEKSRILELNAKAKEKFQEFFEIMNKSYIMWSEKRKMYVNMFVNEFSQYMKKNGFNVRQDGEEITQEKYINIDAEYLNKCISIRNINYDREHMFLYIGDLCATEFWISLPDACPDYEIWKDNINVSGKHMQDFGTYASLSYVKFVDYFNTHKELQEIKDKVQINIEHFSNAIKDIDKYNFCIHKFGSDDTFKDFKDFFNSIEVL